jgi:diguanylate cyclase (GGDEF)-like protein
MFIEKIRFTITLKTALLAFLMVTLTTIVRPMMIEQNIIFTYIGIFNSVVMGCVFLYIKYSKPKIWTPMLFACSGLLVLTPIAFVSGGVNSQFAYLFPIIPMFISLVSNAKYTWIIALIVIVLVTGLYLSVGVFPDYTYENVPQNKTVSRAIWLCLSVLFSTKLGVEFNRIYGSLGDKISEQAETDLLTGLKNRRSVMRFLQIAIDQAKSNNTQLSVMMIDLDHFKAINDTYGHLSGDLCLKQVAKLIQDSVRDASDLAGRFGGEEFIVVIKDIDPQKAADIANKIRSSIEQASIAIKDLKQIKLTATIGICSLRSQQISSIDMFVDLADKALYKGKREGRNRVVVAAAG